MRTFRAAIVGAAVLGATLAGVGAPECAAQSTTYMLALGSMQVMPGDPFVLPIEGDWVESVKGFQLSIGIPQGAPLENIEISVDNSLVGALDPEFIQFNIDTAQGWIVGGVLFEITTPFEGIVLPSVGFPLLVAEIEGTVAASAPEEVIPFEFVDGLGQPPVNNTFIVEFASIPPETVTNGLLDVQQPPDPAEFYFIRGDVNMDGMIDLADPIFHLNHTFIGGPEPSCPDAADANDDGLSDLGDVIFLLNYIFTDGPGPWPPFPNPGPDFTDTDPLDCGQGS